MLNTTFLQGNYIPEANWYLRKAHQKRKTMAQYLLPDKEQKGTPSSSVLDRNPTENTNQYTRIVTTG